MQGLLHHHTPPHSQRATVIFIGAAVIAFFITARLATLQLWQHSFYVALAEGAHEIYKELLPERGTIYTQEGNQLYPLAMNKTLYTAFADARLLENPKKDAEKTADILGFTPEEKLALYKKFSEGKLNDDPYIPIKQKLNEEQKTTLKNANIKGIAFEEQLFRHYPEGPIGAHITGFYGLNKEGKPVGRYGIEGNFNNELSGTAGYMKGDKDPLGAWIPLAKRDISEAEDGDDIVLTIDRSLEYTLCTMLEKDAQTFQAESATLVMIEPSTGEIKTLCNVPTFDPNTYNKVDSIDIYNNKAIFTAYEPGSVFKAITMAAALDQQVVDPTTDYVDTGERKFGKFTIRNAGNKKYGKQTMTNVLEQSINTGMIFVVERLGKEMFKEYVERFGFGKETGVELDTEVKGDISSLEKKGDIYAATASFGQGITATPLQLAASYAALANKGILKQPHIVKEMRSASGERIPRKHKPGQQIISERASALVTGMLVSTIENGHTEVARVPGFYIAGKTGTAQIAHGGEYTDDATNHTFIGYAPAEKPRFVLLVKYEKPKAKYADSTSAVTFGKMAEFLLHYYGEVPTR